MVLFIFESIGTSELLLIGVIALIFLGPRKLPQIARTIGRTMAEFRNTTNEFKSTWEREVNFEEETKAIRTGNLEDNPVPRAEPTLDPEPVMKTDLPEVRQIDPSEFDRSMVKPEPTDIDAQAEPTPSTEAEAADPASDKRSWL